VSALRLVTFDALGTLVGLQPPAPALVATLRQRFGIPVSAAEAERAIAAEIAHYREHFDEGRDAASLLALRERCAEVLRNSLCGGAGHPGGEGRAPRDPGGLPTPRDPGGLPTPAAVALAMVPLDDLVDALLACMRFTVYPDAIEALRDARARGLRTLVVSNWDISLAGVLRELGLGPLLDGVLTSAAVGARKPAPEIFHRALRLAGGVAPEQALHVGDDPHADYEGARAAGLRALLVVREGPAPPACAAIADLRALGSVLAETGQP
jgi:putative hydrolase of the HAD superfamily